MKRSRFVTLAAAVVCLAGALSAGWLWHSRSETMYEARARLVLQGDDSAADDAQQDDEPESLSAEEIVLSPEVLATAATLLRERGIPLAAASAFSSITDYLVDRTCAVRETRGKRDEVQITCLTHDANESLQILSAIIDGCLAEARGSSNDSSDAARGGSGAEQQRITAAIERQDHEVAVLTERLKAAKEAAGGPGGDDRTALEARLMQARRERSSADKHLDAARQDVEKKLPAEVVAARLPEPARSKILERLNVARLKDELHRQRVLLEDSSHVYGRNHPRMAEIREKIATLEQQLSAVAAATVATGSDDQNGPSMVLGALELELADREADEQELETRLAALQAHLTGQRELETQIGQAREELASLHGTHDRLRQKIDAARREEADQLPTISEPPTLSGASNLVELGLHMAVSCGAGLVVFLFLYRQIRAREKAATRAAPRAPASTVRRERFFSQEEEQLVRLKMLSVRG